MKRGVVFGFIFLLVFGILLLSVSVITGQTSEKKGICKGTPTISCAFDYNSCDEQIGCRWEGNLEDGQCIVLPCMSFEHNQLNCLAQGCSWEEFSSEECVLSWASWESDTGGRRINIERTVEGDEVPLHVYGSEGCEGKTISFEIFEDDFGFDDRAITNPENTVFSDGVAIGTWTAEYQNDFFGRPEYYFIATVVGDTDEKIGSFHGFLTLFDPGEELVVKECDEACRALGSICGGIPDPCNSFGSFTPQKCEEGSIFCDLCTNQEGCNLKFNEEAGLLICSDDSGAVSCNSFNSKNECFDQRGCEWVRGAEGCGFTAAYWNTTYAKEGDFVELIVEGAFCEGKEVQFEVIRGVGTGGIDEDLNAELNPENVIFDGNIAKTIWNVEWVGYDEQELSTLIRQNPEMNREVYLPKYFFLVSLVENKREPIRGSGLAAIKCGDKICNDDESYLTCSSDCGEGEEGGDSCKGSLNYRCSGYDSDTNNILDCGNDSFCYWDGVYGVCKGVPNGCSFYNNDETLCRRKVADCVWANYP